MASEFSQKISSIQSDLGGLLKTVGDVEAKVTRATSVFNEMADQADNITALATAIGKINRLLSDNRSPLLDRLRGQVELIANELKKLDDKSVQRVTRSLESQSESLARIASATRRLGTALERTSQGLTSLSTSLDQIRTSGAEVTLKSVSDALASINAMTNIKSVLSSINNVKTDNLQQVILSLQSLKAELQGIKENAKIDIQVTETTKRARSRTREKATQEAEQQVAETTNAPLSGSGRADTSASAANKLSKRAYGIAKVNRAIETIEKAQIEVLRGLVSDAENTDKFELAKRALISRLGIGQNQVQLADEFTSVFPNAGRLRKQFESRLSKINVSTGLGKEYEQINLSDEELINALYTLRKKLSTQAQRLSDASKGDQAQASLLTDIQSFSTSVYRPLSYGITEFGAFMNGIMSVLRGIKVGGISGIIDALGGAFKSLHALNNAGAYFNIPLLPGGAGRIFNKKRSDTLLDLAETTLGISVGDSRTNDARRVRELEYQERNKARQRTGIQELLKDEGLSQANKQRLQNELSELNADLKRLRATIRGYNEVIKDQLDREKSQPHEPLSSTGKELAQAALYRGRAIETTAGASGAYNDAMDKAQSKIDELVRTAKFLSQSEFASRISGIPSNVSGYSASNIAGMAIPTGEILINRRFSPEIQRSTAFHEATHALVNPLGRYDQASGYFVDEELNRLRDQAIDKFLPKRFSPIRYGDTQADAFSAVARQDPGYAFAPDEVYAHVSEALLSGNKKLLGVVREIYGDKLFDKIAADLRKIDPGTFVDIPEGGRKLSSATESVTESVYDRILARIRQVLGPLYESVSNTISTIIQKVRDYLSGRQGLGGLASQASILITGPEDRTTGIRRTYAAPGTQPDLLTQLVTRYEPQINAAISAIAGIARLSGTGGDLGVSGLTGLLTRENISTGIGLAGGALGINTQPLTGLLNIGGAGGAIIDKIVQALVSPATADFRALGNSLKSVNISRVLEQYIKEQFNLRPYTTREFLQQARQLNAPFLGLVARPLAGRVVSDIANTFNADDPNVDPRSVRRGRIFRNLAVKGIIDQLAVRDVNFEQELNDEIRQRTGRNIRRGSYSQQAVFDPVSGLTKFVVSAQNADGAMVSLNAHVDEFGRKKISDPASELDFAAERFGRFIRDVPVQLIQQVTYDVVAGIQQMAANLVSVQDELAEVANLYGVVGDQAETVREAFLSTSVGTAVATGQGFQEAIATNLKNFKLLGAVQDPRQREQLSNQLSTIQLGAQTAFGISLEQSLEAIPAILSDITGKLGGVEDPVERTTLALSELESVMDQIITAQRVTGASGDELITVYSRLAASAREYGLTSRDLIALTATGAVAIGKGEAETSNILRSFLEGTYSQANEAQLLREYGIATRVTNQQTGQIQNRAFTDILNDIVRFTQAPETSGRTAQLLQVFAGPRVAGDIGKFVRGYGTDFARTAGEVGAPDIGGAFSELVGRKIENYQGSINKLNAAGTELFSTFLVGAGVLGKLTNFLEKLADAAQKLSGFIKDNKGAFQLFVNVLTPNIIDRLISGLLGTVNVFSPFVRLLGSAQTVARNLFAQLLGFDRVTRPTDRVQLSIKGIIAALDALERSGGKASAGLIGGLRQMAATAQQAQASIIATTQAATTASIGPGAALQQARAAAPGGPGALIGNRRLLRSARQIAQEVEQAYNAETPRVSGQARLNQRAAQFLGRAGDAAGAVLAPLGFDVLAGGLRTDTIATNAGAAIGGAFVGAVTGNPALGVFFYSIIGEALDRIDVGKFFHLSDREADAFSDAFARRLRRAVNAQTQEDIDIADEEQRKREQREQAGRIARSRYGDIAEGFGITSFEQIVQADIQRSRGARGIAPASVAGSSADLERYRRLVVEQREPEGFLDKYFTSIFNKQGREQAGRLYEALGTDELRNLYAQVNISDPRKFLQIFQELRTGTSPLLERPEIQQALIAFNARAQAGQGFTPTAEARTAVVLESAEEILNRLNDNIDGLTTAIQREREIPYGLAEYSPFGARAEALRTEFEPRIAESLKDTSKEGREHTQALIEQFERGKEALDSLPQSLQVLIPLAEALGLATDGLEQKLYDIGAAGQGQLVQRFEPALEATSFNRLYEQRQRNLRDLQATDQFRAKDPQIVKEVEALNKALTADKARYAINQAYLSTLKEQTNVLLDQAGAIEKQQQQRRLISPGTAGTPAQFTPAGIFDTRGVTSVEINKAIEFALQKQARLVALNPEYQKEFAKDQFLLQSGLQFKGVTGVNQGFVQEYLQQQKQQAQAPLEDLSKFTDAEVQNILNQARALQGQAEQLDPSRAGKYEDERVLILRKNNDLLAQTGIGQEFLRLAIQQNTKSQDQLRGHYNIPSNYRLPTVFDYYAQGGREQGEKNFPTIAGQGLVPLAFAQQLAQQLIAGGGKETGANLEEILGTAQPGARPLFYPTPGTPGTAAVYEEVPPQILPDTIGTDRKISDAVLRFMEFKDRQIADFEDAVFGPKTTSTPAAQQFAALKDRQLALREEQLFAPSRTPAQVSQQAAYQNLVNIGQPLGAPPAGAVIQPTVPIGPVTTTLPPNATILRQQFALPTQKPADAYYADLGKPISTEKTKASLDTLGRSTDGARTDIALLGTSAQKAGSVLSTAISALPAATAGVGTLATSTASFTTAVTTLLAKITAFDLAQALKGANVQVQVTVNGQAVPAAQTQVTINNAAATGTNRLSAGPGGRSGSRI